MSSEYESLREEILAWQNRRFMILTASITFVSAILGLDAVQKNTAVVEWSLITSLLWLFLSSMAVLTWYAGRANAKIATYLRVFHEENGGWESRLAPMSESAWFNLNIMVLLVYGGLGIFSLVIPCSIRYSVVIENHENQHFKLLLFSGVCFLVALIRLGWGNPSKKYIEKWEVVKTEKSKQKNKNNGWTWEKEAAFSSLVSRSFMFTVCLKRIDISGISR